MPGDPNKYQYGNDPNAAANEARKLNEQGQQGQARQGEQINTGNADQSRGAANDARGAQLRMADMMYRRASGQTPSIAGMVGDRQMGQAAAEQSSAAASARGPAAMALAQQGAANNTAAVQGQISNQTQINSANERMQAEQAAFGAYSGMRGGDQSQQGQDFAQSAAQAQINAQQRQQNDAFQLGNQGQAQGVQGMQLGANMNQDAADRADYWNQQGLDEQKRARNESTIMGIAGMGASVGSSIAMMSDEQTKIPARFGSKGVSPGGIGYGTSARDDAPGYDPDSVSMARMVAHQTLSAQASHDAAASADDQALGGGGGQMMAMSNAGVGALKQRDSEDLGLIQSKERNGVDLSAKESSSKASLQHRAGQEKAATAVQGDRSAAAKALSKAEDKPGMGDAAGGGLKGIGTALSSMGASMRPQESWKPMAAQRVAMPQPAAAPVTWSDEDTKTVAPLRDERDGRGEQHYDRDMTSAPAKSKLSNDDGSDSSTPKPKPKAPAPAAKASGPRKMTMAELLRAAGEMQSRNDAQRTQLDEGPAIGMRTTSDDHAKVAVAQREAFAAGLKHANEAAETGKFGPVPDYVASGGPGGGKQQPPSTERTASVHTATRPTRAATETTPAQHNAQKLKKYLLDDEKGTRAPAWVNTPSMGADPLLVPKAIFGAGELTDATQEFPKNAPVAMDRVTGSDPGRAVATVRSDARTKVGHLGKEMPVGDMAEAARSMKAVPYAYKPGFAGEEGQKPGEVNVGPVAQEMQKSPVAATAVKQDSPDGLRSIDIPKYTKVLGGIAASQQEQLDEQQRQISFMASRLRSKR